MAIVQMTRIKQFKDRTLGLMDIGDLSLTTLELPWNDNKRNESCIPAGFYKITKRFSYKYKNHLFVHDVPNRSDILIHFGNFPQDTKGCIVVGDDFKDINADGEKEVVNSRHAIKLLLDALKDDDNYLNITEAYEENNV